MMLGREVNLPLDIMYEKLPNHIVDQEAEYIRSLKERMTMLEHSCQSSEEIL